MLTPGDEEILTRLVGWMTFARGRAYAREGAVKSSKWSEDGTCLFGEVQGGARMPYEVTVFVTRSGSGRIVDIDGTCTCPVEIYCKHAVALLLADGAGPDVSGGEIARTARAKKGSAKTAGTRTPSTASGTRASGNVTGRPARRSVSKRAPRAPSWEGPLHSLLTAGEPDPDDPAQSDLGLQFELVSAAAKGSKSHAPVSGIRIRPIKRNSGGNWVRTGISWSQLPHFSYGRSLSPRGFGQLSVLTELLALSRLSVRHDSYYRSADENVWLQSIHSRRLWDLLSQARDLRLPLLQAGRQAVPIDLRPGLARFTLDARRTDAGIEIRPLVRVDGEAVPLGSSILVGQPAHGIAWWGGASDVPGGTERLGLAPFASSLDDQLRGFLGSSPLTVPPGDEDRFLRDFCPRLRRLVEVESSDGSVDLPELPEARIILSVKHREGHHVELEWSRGAASHDWRENLWGASGSSGDHVAENAIIEAITAVVAPMPGLLETTLFGERLARVAVLQGMAAARFVTELLPALSEVDGIEVEHDGSAIQYREVLDAPLVSLGGSHSDDRDWFDLSVTVSVDGEDVPFIDLFIALAEGCSHLILPSGTFFSLDRDELRRLADLIAEARALGDEPDGVIRLSRFQASLWEDLQRLGVVTAQAREWEASVRDLVEAGNRIEHAVPDGLDATLRPYQLTGFNWLAYLYEHRLGGVLADDMGLGKTIQALSLMCHTKEHGLSRFPYLVVAPTSVVGNWAAESARFAPGLRALTVTETETRRGVALGEMAREADLVVTSYALFRIEYEDYASLDWAGLFMDEAQFAKNRSSQAYRLAKMLPTSFKVAMTGTPIENNLMELWSLLSITAPGLFASPDRFTDHYRTPIEKKGDSERLAQLRRRIRPLMLRRTKDQVARDLPDKQEQVLELELNPRHGKLYQTYLQRERQKVLGLLGDMQRNRFEIFRSLTLLRQASLDMSLVDAKHAKVPSTKLDALMEMIEDIVADGHRVLVFSQFTRFLALARKRIERAGIDHCYLDGRTRKRDIVVSEFRSGTAPVFLISLKAGGFGLNLTEADYCIILDPWWNPAIEAQAVDRTHRIGQTRKVMVYRLVAKDTLEEKVMALKAKKSALITNVMDSGEFESGVMTAEDIQELLS